MQTMSNDVLAVIKELYGDSPPAIVLVGHRFFLFFNFFCHIRMLLLNYLSKCKVLSIASTSINFRCPNEYISTPVTYIIQLNH